MSKRRATKRVRPLDGRPYAGGWRTSYADGLAAVDTDVKNKRDGVEAISRIPLCEPRRIAAIQNALRAINPETEKRLRAVYTTHSKSYWDGVNARRKELASAGDLHQAQTRLMMNKLREKVPADMLARFLRNGGNPVQLLASLTTGAGE